MMKERKKILSPWNDFVRVLISFVNNSNMISSHANNIKVTFDLLNKYNNCTKVILTGVILCWNSLLCRKGLRSALFAQPLLEAFLVLIMSYNITAPSL